MAHRGLFSRKVVASAKVKRKVARSTVVDSSTPTTAVVPASADPSSADDPHQQPSTSIKKPKWGTPEERYRRLCMLCLLCRMTYYIHGKSIVSDDTYDKLERTIRDVEERNRELIHPNSPTFHPGSDKESDYPSSARTLWSLHKDDPSTWEAIECAVISFTKETRETFGIDSNNQKNS